MAEYNSPIYCIVGATASGKTALSIALAQALGGPSAAEIISADAMQLYRGMDIGTAKITNAEKCGILHHQIDVLDIKDEASVAKYQELARNDLEKICERGKTPIIVGGSGLYISALIDKLDFPGTDETIRSELNQIWETSGLEPLIAELFRKDPITAETINLANPRRVIRALEVVRLTGKSYTPVFPRHTSHYSNVVQIGVNTAKEILHQRIFARAQKMFANGLLEETQTLITQGLRDAATAKKLPDMRKALQLSTVN
ncbi:tRNA (adenosine(37)-N6)-dimethylallyltransferase MiaA [Arcanobacterium hippocoleae]